MRENTPDAHIHYRPADHAQNTSITASPHVMRRLIAPLLGGLLLALSGLVAARSATDATTRVPPPALDEAEGSAATEIAVLAGGCFWGVQGVFQHLQGVTGAVSGYAGGSEATAHYNAVSTSITSHAESVRVTFDPRRITYGRILQIYFSVAHDPTQLDYQGPDRGPQYRSTIFPQTDEQAKIAKAYIDQLGRVHAFRAPIVTTVEPGHEFYSAESYHQDFLTRHPTNAYIVYYDLPKIRELQRQFPALYRNDPVLVAAQ
jgi:peptide-methionine (S)-S-oxide reductase